MIKKLVQTALVLAAFGGVANASTFDFSYAFGDGLSLTGSLDGTLSGQLVTDISDVTVDFDGTAFNGPLFAGSFVPGTGGAAGTYDFSSNAAVVSTNASLNNFVFIDSNDPGGVGGSNYFYFVNGVTPSGLGTQEVVAANGNTGAGDFDNLAITGTSGTWSLTPAPVPLPAGLPLLVSGLGLLAGAARRRLGKAA